MVGAAAAPTTKSLLLVAVPLALLMVILPVLTSAGALAVRLFAVAAVTVAGLPLNLTTLFAATVSKPLPEIVTAVPALPLEGENSAIDNAVLAFFCMPLMLPTAS